MNKIKKRCFQLAKGAAFAVCCSSDGSFQSSYCVHGETGQTLCSIQNY